MPWLVAGCLTTSPWGSHPAWWRAFNAITGEFAWAWDMGRPGNHSEPLAGEVYTRGTPNVWSLFSVDEELGLIYAPHRQ